MATSSVSAQQFGTINQFAAPPKNYLKIKAHGPMGVPNGRRAADPAAPAEAVPTSTGPILNAAADANGVFKVASLL